ncbi:MAG: HNH endonuclease [Deltaproteobacteria bacterium]|nr:HNH endonuclease [Deltaproteobacteria bacterium]
MTDKANIIKSMCDALSFGNESAASNIARSEYPFTPPTPITRTFTETQALRVFLRDGFIDRYSGSRLVFPPVLRVLSLALPEEFPYHRNWKMTETHKAYWELFPTLDHVTPVAIGGRDDDDNLVSTSMLHNAAKAHWTLEELGWSLHPPGDLTQWDGMLVWLLDFVERDRRILSDKYVNSWCLVARSFCRGDQPVAPTIKQQ